MPLQRITDYCPICATKLFGRLDKRFCSSGCRSIYFRNKVHQQKPVTYPVDAILHRNWKILSQLFGTIGRRKFFVELSDLCRRGFHPDYYTSSATNNAGKKYFYLYDFAWMEFSKGKLMILKLNKPR